MFWLNVGVPKAITTDAQILPVCLDCAINIPSNLHVSALDAQEVVWFRIKQGVTEQVGNAKINADYSLSMTHVTRGDAATYFAQATSTDGAAANGPQVELMVIKKPCEPIYGGSNFKLSQQSLYACLVALAKISIFIHRD